MVEITAFRLESKSCKGFFLEDKLSTNESTQIITGHVIYNPAYTYKFQLKTTLIDTQNRLWNQSLYPAVLVSQFL